MKAKLVQTTPFKKSTHTKTSTAPSVPMVNYFMSLFYDMYLHKVNVFHK